ncbi:MAG: GntR family transcriptional regulator [Rhodospirillaceae bacterium]|nr:GntR family transcriptional regulator [Rhodospirillaceae bacterium]
MAAIPTVPRTRNSVDDIRQILADDILLGRLAPGTHLSEACLALRFGVSRTPIREALNQIVASGLVERRANAGVRVYTIPKRRLEDMFELAAEIEATCARLAAQRILPQERTNLLAIHETVRSSLAHENADAYDAANLAFHTAIFAASHNSYVFEAAQAARARVIPYRRAQFTQHGRMHISFTEHHAILAAILTGDGDTAERAMRTHVGAAGDASCHMFKDTAVQVQDTP